MREFTLSEDTNLYRRNGVTIWKLDFQIKAGASIQVGDPITCNLKRERVIAWPIVGVDYNGFCVHAEDIEREQNKPLETPQVGGEEPPRLGLKIKATRTADPFADNDELGDPSIGG
ncbi:MAG: hypothetical protein A2542_02595 [Parcubacteria group bacterium RIFOXYD2_FULL_52_8]|nr:MAG: hypothetical protein A2542_02595 [Parcubacteria group bacterium RIFOXYD2_FULL_52_8]